MFKLSSLYFAMANWSAKIQTKLWYVISHCFYIVTYVDLKWLTKNVWAVGYSLNHTNLIEILCFTFVSHFQKLNFVGCSSITEQCVVFIILINKNNKLCDFSIKT